MKCIDCNSRDAVNFASGLCERCSPIQRGDDPSAIKARVDQSREAHDYHMGLSDSEREMMQRASFNFHEQTGRKMKIPSRLFSDLKSKGVDMRWMEPSAGLEQ